MQSGVAINTIGNASGYSARHFMGLRHDASGGYRIAWLVSGCVALLAPVLIAASGIRRYVRRVKTPAALPVPKPHASLVSVPGTATSIRDAEAMTCPRPGACAVQQSRFVSL